ncbi:MAG: hypothetical protein M3P06_11365 [Acidobacteriota bacterium]|nr:hypothetical protein [Acidobacteriota bacterium]
MMKKYQYFGKTATNAMVPLFEAVAEVEPSPADIETAYHEVVRQQGLGVPRPTHFIELELMPIDRPKTMGAALEMLLGNARKEGEK